MQSPPPLINFWFLPRAFSWLILYLLFGPNFFAISFISLYFARFPLTVASPQDPPEVTTHTPFFFPPPPQKSTYRTRLDLFFFILTLLSVLWFLRSLPPISFSFRFQLRPSAWTLLSIFPMIPLFRTTFYLFEKPVPVLPFFPPPPSATFYRDHI